MSQHTIAPLDGLRILDFSALLPGPFATHVLADLGADVLRVESPDRPDLLRSMRPKVGVDSAAHATINRSKRSLALDLKLPCSIEVIRKLITATVPYDILIEGFRPGVMQRLGLDFETLRAMNPRLIYCSLSGYGQTGPLSRRAGHDIDYLARSGSAGYSGDAQRGPALAGVQIADFAGAMYAVAGILAAVIHRQRAGEGQHVDISLTDSAFTLNALQAPGVLCGAPAPQPQATELNGGGHYGHYRSRDGRWFAVGALEPQFLSVLLNTLGIESAFHEGDELRQRIASAFARRDYAEWLDAFARVEACVEPVLTLAEAVVQPQLIAREMVIDVPGPNGEVMRQPGCAIKFAGCKLPPPRFSGARLGAHNENVLATLE